MNPTELAQLKAARAAKGLATETVTKDGRVSLQYWSTPETRDEYIGRATRNGANVTPVKQAT